VLQFEQAVERGSQRARAVVCADNDGNHARQSAAMIFELFGEQKEYGRLFLEQKYIVGIEVGESTRGRYVRTLAKINFNELTGRCNISLKYFLSIRLHTRAGHTDSIRKVEYSARTIKTGAPYKSPNTIPD
jgi:hypothetical protein